MPDTLPSTPGDNPGSPLADDAAQSRTIPLVQEEASVSRVVEDTGGAVRVRVASRGETQRLPLTEAVDDVSVERVEINRYVSERSEPRQEGEVLVIPVYQTVAVVEARLLLKEEVRIRRQRREVQRETEVALRGETAIVERRNPGEDEWQEVRIDRKQSCEGS